MWISNIELQNIKSYGERTQIEFKPGINAICGHNGAGKSTILEAIGYVLFDRAPYKPIKNFVNERAKRGKIVVTLVDSRDERPYRVVRPVGGGTAYVEDPETETRLAEGTADVRQWLTDRLLLQSSLEAKSLFEHAVGVSQGLLTASFAETRAAARKKVFDPLLGVEEYEQAWGNLRESLKLVETRQHDNEKQQERLAGRLEALPEVRSVVEKSHQNIGRLQAAQDANQTAIIRLTEHVSALQKQADTVQALQHQQNRLQERVRGQQAQVESARSALTEAEKARKQVKTHQAGYEAYMAAQAERPQLEAQRQAQDTIKTRLSHAKNDLARLTQRLDDLTERLHAAQQAATRLTELTPQLVEQERLEHDQKTAQADVMALKQAQSRVDEVMGHVEQVTQRLSNTQAEVVERESILIEIEELQRKHADHQNEMNQIEIAQKAFETTWETVNQTLYEAKQRLHEYETKQKEKQELSTRQRNMTAELATLQTQLDQREALTAQVSELTHQRTTRQHTLEKLSEQIETHTKALTRQREEQHGWQDQVQQQAFHQRALDKVRQRLTKAEQIQQALKAGLTERQQLMAEVTILEQEQAELHTQRDGARDSKGRTEATLQEIASAKTLTVEAGHACPVCQKSLAKDDLPRIQEHYQQEEATVSAELARADADLKQCDKDLRRVRRLLKKHRQIVEKLPHAEQVSQHETTMQVLRTEIKELTEQIQALTDAPTEVERLAGLLMETEAQIKALKAKQKRFKSAEKVDEKAERQLQSKLQKLPRPEDATKLKQEIESTAEKIIILQAILAEHAKVPAEVDRLVEQVAELQEKRSFLQKKRAYFEELRVEVESDIQKYQTQLIQLATPQRVTELQAELDGHQKRMAEWQAKVDTLADSPARLAEIQTQLQALGNPRQAYQQAKVIANQHDELAQALAEEQTQQTEQKGLVDEISDELTQFAELEAEFARVKTTMQTHEAAHRTYLAQQGLAETFPERKSVYDMAQQQLQTVTDEATQVKTALDKAQDGYDQTAHQQAESVLQDEQKTEVQLATELSHEQSRQTELTSKLDDLLSVEQERLSLVEQAKDLAQLRQTTRFLRDTIRKAGPEVTKRLVKAISNKASQIFGEIMDNHRAELVWDESYAIIVRRKQTERSFQQLSGGERMAASLAVRLALLQGMSMVDVAFFDEPTANLDMERRASLAQQIARIKGFSQLVVISHDDTFEQDSGHVIHISKDELGFSRVGV